MEYKLGIPTPYGSAISLARVAIEMATAAATLNGTHSFHGPTYEALLPGYETDLLVAAHAGLLVVCNQRGAVGTAKEVIEAEGRRLVSLTANQDMNSDEAQLSLLCTTVQGLNDWRKPMGDTFVLFEVPVKIIDFDLRDKTGNVLVPGHFRGVVGSREVALPAGAPVAAPAEVDSSRGVTWTPEKREELRSEHRALTAAKCKAPTRELAQKYGVSESRIRELKRKETAKPGSKNPWQATLGTKSKG